MVLSLCQGIEYSNGGIVMEIILGFGFGTLVFWVGIFVWDWYQETRQDDYDPYA